MAIKLRTEIGSRLRNSRVPHRLFGSLLRGSSREVGRWLPAPALRSLLFAPTSSELQTPSSRFVFGNARFPADLRLWDLVNLDMLSAVRRQNLANKSKIESEICLYQSVGYQISISPQNNCSIAASRQHAGNQQVPYPMPSFVGDVEATKATTRCRRAFLSAECMLFYAAQCYRASRQPSSGASGGGVVNS